MLELTDTTFNSVLEANHYVLVDFSATWCGPCKTLAPAFEAVAEKLKDRVTFAKADLDACGERSIEHDVEVVPTLILFKDGMFKKRMSGVLSATDLEAWVTSNL